jgi:biopolymer transport protein ExbD
MSTKSDSTTHATPFINVTPLIDVLLVVLIIFMVATPLKPARFETKVPTQRDPEPHVVPNPWTLVVSIDADHRLKLNGLAEDMGTVEDTAKLSAKLAQTFSERIRNHSWRYEMAGRSDLSDEMRVERTVFVKAPRALDYGLVMRVIDGIKGAGASPIGLQIDDLQ